MRIWKTLTCLLVVGIMLGCFGLQQVLAQNEDLTTRSNQLVAESQNNLDTAKFALEEISNDKMEMQEQLEAAREAGDQEAVSQLQAQLNAVNSQLEQATQLVEQIEAQHSQVMNLLAQAENAASQDQAQATLAAVEAISSSSSLLAASAQNTLEAAIQFQQGAVQQGQASASRAASLQESADNAQDDIQAVLSNLNNGDFDQVNTQAQTIVQNNLAAAESGGDVVAGGPGSGSDTGGTGAGGVTGGGTGAGLGGGPGIDVSAPQAAPSSDNLDDASPAG